MKHRLLVVFGTRPEAVKMAPLVAAAKASNEWEPVVAVTGQHREMLDVVLDVFGLSPEYDLDIFEPGQPLETITARCIEGVASVIRQVAPAAVVVQGDTSTTFAAALAAFYQRIPVIHVEAGLRTNDIGSPYPEEANRRMTSQLTSLHLCPTQLSAENLIREGFDSSTILVTGNTVIDALRQVTARADEFMSTTAARFIEGHPYIVVTSHRRESWEHGHASIARGISQLAQEFQDYRFVLPMHLNPVVRDQMSPILRDIGNVLLMEPLPYPSFSALLHGCRFVITDSGGIQEEAPSLGKPVLVTRDTTERPEAVMAGAAALVGTDCHALYREAKRLIIDEAFYSRMASARSPYGDGRAAERSVAAITAHLLGGPMPLPFLG